MKKLMMVMGLVLVGTAAGQSWDVKDLGKLSLVGCYGKQDGVYCDFSFTLTKKQTARVYWENESFKIFKQDGTSQLADKMAFIDGKFDNVWGDSSPQEIIANVPVKVQAYFNTPSSTSGFRALAYQDQKFDNIPVRSSEAPPKTPTTLPTPSGIKGFAIALSNCQLQGQNYVCTAVLTPTK